MCFKDNPACVLPRLVPHESVETPLKHKASATQKAMKYGLYFHIPFCETKCSYCCFLSIPGNDMLAERYAAAVVKELEKCTPMDLLQMPVDSIYFGGGTPSLIPPSVLENILYASRTVFDIVSDCEITIEANPGTLEKMKINAYGEMGINRISLGAQSFQDSELAVIGRTHSSRQIYRTVRDLQQESMENVNLDLILGLPGQSRHSWMDNLCRVVDLGPRHISVYMLDLSPQTPLYDLVERGDVSLPCEDEVADWYLDTIDYLKSAGYPQYEISNFSIDGFQCKHNLKYWLRHPVLGFGLGSHSFDIAKRYANMLSLRDYLDAVESGRSPIDWSESADPTRVFEETIFLGLRLCAGLNWDKIRARYDQSRISECEKRLRWLKEEGLVEWKDRTVRLTSRGMLLSNEVFQEFIGL